MLGQKTDLSKKNASWSKNSDTELNRSKHILVKGPKPLQKLKFYLDVKNHAVTSKLEGKIKELGGVVEFFLDREVTHVISDHPQCVDESKIVANSPATPRLHSVDSVYTNYSPTFASETSTTGRLRQKTRADAMLEKVRSQSAAKVRDPLQNAKLWGIPIWTVNKVFAWLEKVSVSVTVSTSVQKSKKSVKVISIKSPFVKFEPIARNARPVYKTIQSWPIIDLESSPGKPAFIVKSNHSQNQQKIIETNTKGTEKDQFKSSGTNGGSTMTRKQRTRLSVRAAGKEQDPDKQALVGGFCEICHCEYREIGEHVRSEQHLNFVKNDTNFLELDNLISAGANVEAFLRLNGNSGKDLNNSPLFGRRSLRKLNGKSSSPEKCNGTIDDYSPPVTRNKMPRTRSSNHSPLSQTAAANNDVVHHLRSRGQLWLPSNLLGTTAEDEPFSNKIKDSIRSDNKKNSRASASEDDAKSTKENESEKVRSSETGRPKRTCPKTKRISADERLVADNKTYYKVEVMTTKLRSSGLGTKEAEVVRRTQTPIPEEMPSEEQGLVVKFKRVRRSELSVLNDEAENFMFPRKDDPSYSDEDTDEAPHTTRSTIKSDSSDLKSSEHDKSSIKSDMDDSMTSCDTENVHVIRKKRKRNDTKSDHTDMEESSDAISFEDISLRRKIRKGYSADVDDNLDESSKDGSVACESEAGGRRRKRRTHAELFIADNQRYYKFETPGSRLRYQGMFFPHTITKSETPVKNNGEYNEIKEDDDDDDENKPCMPQNDLRYSFEILPLSEPWYQTFKRQDSGGEYYSYTSDSGYWSRFILPYQLPYIVPLDKKICIEEYKKKKYIYLNQQAVLLDSGSNAENSNSGFSIELGQSFDSAQLQPQPPVRRKKRKSRFLKLNHPRKSPRQHASTLAILSSLIHQRKKRERKSHGESDTSRASLTSIPEEDPRNISQTTDEIKEKQLSEKERLLQEQQTAAFEKKLQEILTASIDDVSDPIAHFNDSEGVFVNDRPDAIDIIENFDNKDNIVEYADVTTPLAPDCGRTVRRKRKKNRTGWPKKKRLFVKRCEQKSEDGNCSLPELEDSRLTEILIEDENREIEMCELDADAEETIQMCDNKDLLLRTKLQELSDGDGDDDDHDHKQSDSNEADGDSDSVLLVGAERGEDDVGNVEQQDDGEGEESVLQIKEEKFDKSSVVVLQNNTIQGVSNCTERIIHSVNVNKDNKFIDNSDENKTKSVLGVATENMNNNSVSDIKMEDEVQTNLKSDTEVTEKCESGKNISGTNVTSLTATTTTLHHFGEKTSSPSHDVNIHSVTENDNTTTTTSSINCSDSTCKGSTNISLRLSSENKNQNLQTSICNYTDKDEMKKSIPPYTVSVLGCNKKSNTDMKKIDVPSKKNERNSSSDCSGTEGAAEEVIASRTDKIGDCVNVALDKWENAEKVLHAKMNDNETVTVQTQTVPSANEKMYQPFVRVQKIDNTNVALNVNRNRRLRSSSSPERKPKAKRAKIAPPSPRSPRKLRVPRGKWYRER